jgi:hypothetical protein
MMKKSTKLAINRETLRVLANLDLARVAAGTGDRQLVGTDAAGTGCPFAPAVQPKP